MRQGHAKGDIEMELLLPGPDVSTVAVDHERQIAEQLDLARRLRAAIHCACAIHYRN
jgi:hypothetical protein